MKYFTLLCLLLSHYIHAQDLEPRNYTNIPVGMNFVLLGYGYTTGEVLFDPTVPLDDAIIKTHGTVMAYARSLKVGRMSGKFDMIVPYAWLSGTAGFQGQTVSREISGLADPRFRLALNFVGSPALSLSDFKNYKQKLIIGANLQVSMPLGQYDHDRLVNIGTNRFAIKPELGISRKYGRVILEIAGGATFFTVNHDFYLGQTRAQNPIGYVQSHIVYTFKNGVWAALDGTYFWGGRTTLEGVEQNDNLNNTRMGLTLAVPLNVHHSLKFYFSTGTSTRTGADFDAIGCVWQYRWARKN